MEAGALGTEVNQSEAESLLITAYFDEKPNCERVRAELLDGLRIYGLESSSLRSMKTREIVAQDWLREWKKSWQPVEIGERFIVAPPWIEISETSNRVVIRIEPGMAFGTGTHETTRLCLVAIEKYFEGGTFLDVGTGTGILAIAAAKLIPAAHIEAFDTDPDAVAIARANAELNGVSEHVTLRVRTVEQTTASFDFVCANLTAEVIVSMLPTLIGITCGRLILSGILEAQIDTVRDRLQELAISQPYEITTEGEWSCIVV
jgi:ribosomal protein L11 methyltransferase